MESTDPENADCIHICNWYDVTPYGMSSDYEGYCQDGYQFSEELINVDVGWFPYCATICTKGGRMVGGFEIGQMHRL